MLDKISYQKSQMRLASSPLTKSRVTHVDVALILDL
jgi:hypothetical protein